VDDVASHTLAAAAAEAAWAKVEDQGQEQDLNIELAAQNRRSTSNHDALI
jgi:hypothetical protein